MKQLVKALFGAALLLAFASCSNSSDNSAMLALLAQGGGSGSSPTEITWSAKAEANGIRFSIGALPSRYWSHTVFIEDQNKTRCWPNWGNKAAAWSGLYPLVTAGNSYTFILHVANGNDTYNSNNLQVTATGGLGELSYSADSWSVTLSTKTYGEAKTNGYTVVLDQADIVETNPITVNVQDSDTVLCIDTVGFSISNPNVANSKLKLAWYNGNGWDGTTWDGVWIGETEVFEAGKHGRTKNAFNGETYSKMTIASNKKTFAEVKLYFDVSGYTDFQYSLKNIVSAAITYPW